MVVDDVAVVAAGFKVDTDLQEFDDVYTNTMTQLGTIFLMIVIYTAISIIRFLSKTCGSFGVQSLSENTKR